MSNIGHSNSFKKVEKVNLFCDSLLGEWKPNKKQTNKQLLVFSRSAEVTLAEQYAQDWIDPVDFKKKKVFGKVKLVEDKIITKDHGNISFTQLIEPMLQGGVVKDII
jgi:hypothetical protein